MTVTLRKIPQTQPTHFLGLPAPLCGGLPHDARHAIVGGDECQLVPSSQPAVARALVHFFRPAFCACRRWAESSSRRRLARPRAVLPAHWKISMPQHPPGLLHLWRGDWQTVGG